MKILIAEDDTTSQLFSAALRKLGRSVAAAEDGHKAWEAGSRKSILSSFLTG